MALRFVRTDGSNSNDGLDAWGFALTGAAYDDTGHGDGNHRLQAASGTPFSSVVAGDLIYLTGGTGITVGLYTVAAQISSTVVTLTASAGSDASDVTTSSGPWATVQFGADTMTTAGDELRICANATHAPSARLDFDTAAGTFASPMRYQGANSRGVVDGTVATISASALSSSTDLCHFNITNLCAYFADLRFTGGGGGRILFTNGGGVYAVTFRRCRVDSAVNTGAGFGGSGATSAVYMLFDCEIDHCAGAGMQSTLSTRGAFQLRRCRVHHNGANGVLLDTAAPHVTSMSECLVYRNSGDGIAIAGGGVRSFSMIDHCVSAFNTGDGISVTSSGFVSITNTIMRSNGGYGLETTGGASQLHVFDNNCFSNNTSGDTDLSATPGTGHITSNPLFVDETDGSEDFSLQSGSPCIEAGIAVAIA